MKQISTLLFSAFCMAMALGQTPLLLKDINPGSGSSIPNFEKGIISWNGKVYFAANDGSTGNELWVTDGTAAGAFLLKDIYPGATGSDCQNFIPTTNFIYFTATDDVNGLELWRTDGTAAGTQLVKDIRPGTANGVYVPSSSQTKRFYLWNDVLYFTANEGTNGVELWKSDGTASGTELVKNINTSNLDSYPTDFAEYNGKLYFQARSGLGSELWVTDGSAAGTVLLKDIYAGAFGSSPSDFIACNGYLLFLANDGVAQQELWRSDGTTAGTVLVKDINPTQFASGMQTQPNTFEKRLVKIGDVVYFSANDGMNGSELWRSDGTDAGTMMVKDASTDPTGYAPQVFAVLDDVLYYKYDNAINGIELWRSDGTAAGTYLLKDCKPGSNASFFLPSVIAEAAGAIWFGTEGSSSTGKELWTSDGTEMGTVAVADLNPGSGDSNPFQFVSLPDLVIFGATGPAGTELYVISLNVVPLSIDLTVTNNVPCFGEAVGALELGIAGGVAPYTITWSPSTAQGQSPMNLIAGTYSVTVIDGNGTTLTAQAEITQPTQLTATTSSMAATYSNANGSALVVATGGTSPYTYLWNNTPASTTASIANAIAGDYAVTITDANGCSLIKSVTVDMDTAVDDVFANSISIAPTISNGQFTILSNQSMVGITVKLLNLEGICLKTWENAATGQTLAIEQTLDGLFLLQINADGKQAVKKLVFKN